MPSTSHLIYMLLHLTDRPLGSPAGAALLSFPPFLPEGVSMSSSDSATFQAMWLRKQSDPAARDLLMWVGSGGGSGGASIKRPRLHRMGPPGMVMPQPRGTSDG